MIKILNYAQCPSLSFQGREYDIVHTGLAILIYARVKYRERDPPPLDLGTHGSIQDCSDLITCTRTKLFHDPDGVFAYRV